MAVCKGGIVASFLAMAAMAECGFTELCCALGHMPETIRRHFGDGSRFGVRMEYRTEPHPLGTAGR